ncbi:MAG: DUF420 domain-containing protein [Verrucomicrobiota bacterium]
MNWLQLLPAINAALNFTATLFLTAGFVLIKQDKRNAHRFCMVGAFSISAIFLALYLTHKGLKASAGADVNTKFAGEGIWPWVYYPMLISHVLLSIIMLPMIFRTFFLAFKERFEKHRKWARITFPIWYYVSITGVLVYFFLYQWFPST